MYRSGAGDTHFSDGWSFGTKTAATRVRCLEHRDTEHPLRGCWLAAVCQMLLIDIDLEPLGRYLGQQQKDNHPLAAIGNYQGQFGFYGRLQQPIARVTLVSAKAWAQQNLSGLIVAKKRTKIWDSAPIDLRKQTFNDD